MQTILERLTHPSTHLTQEEPRQQARIFSALVLVFLGALLFVAPSWLFYMPHLVAAHYILLLALGQFVLAYALSRTPYYQIGVAILVVAILGMVGFVLVLIPAPIFERMLALPFLLVAVMLASLFWPRHYTAAIVFLSLSFIATFFFVPSVPQVFTYTYLAFFLLAASIGGISTFLNQHYKRHLIEREALYRSLVAAMSEGIVLQMRDGSIRECNKAAEQILGLTADQMMGRKSIDPRWQAIHQDGSPFPGQAHPAMVTLRTGHPLNRIIMGVHHPNGDLRWISINSQPLFMPNEPLPYAVVASFTDITQRKQAEQALLQSEARYRSMFENNKAVKLLIEPETGAIVDANTAASDFYGYSHPQLLAMRIQDINTLSPEEITAEIEQARTERRTVFHFQHRLANGTLRDVEVFSGPVTIQGQPHLYSIILDETARKQMEVALRQSEERYKRVIDTQSELICRYRLDSTLVFANDAFCRYFGQSHKELLGQSFLNLLPVGQQYAAYQHYLWLLKNPEQGHDEYEYEDFSAAGDSRWLAWVGRVITDPEGQPLEVQLVGRDITERKQALQREFELALEKERTQLLSTFIQNATHEFKNPLAVIGTTSFLMARMDNPEKRQQKLNIINEQVQRMAKLIDKLLTMTRLNTLSPSDLEMVAVDMGIAAEMADQMVLARRTEWEPLVWQIPAYVPPVLGVKDNLVEAVAQILDNAYHFTPCTGTITVSLGNTDTELWLTVEDTGAGIDEEDLPHLFEVFWRLDVAHTTPGFGLGLPIAQRIIQLHGGRIELTSTLGVGTAVTIWLPLAPIG